MTWFILLRQSSPPQEGPPEVQIAFLKSLVIVQINASYKNIWTDASWLTAAITWQQFLNWFKNHWLWSQGGVLTFCCLTFSVNQERRRTTFTSFRLLRKTQDSVSGPGNLETRAALSDVSVYWLVYLPNMERTTLFTNTASGWFGPDYTPYQTAWVEGGEGRVSSVSQLPNGWCLIYSQQFR